MRFTEVTELTGETSFNCYMCGERRGRGSEWHGHGSALNICGDHECRLSVVKLLLDIVQDDAVIEMGDVETEKYLHDLVSEVMTG